MNKVFPKIRRYRKTDDHTREPNIVRIPVHFMNSKPVDRSACALSEPKIVRIPVRFMNSKIVDRSACALRIQKFLRGFLVRKSMRKIKEVNIQIDKIKEKLMNGEFYDSIRSNEKERLKLGENLMSLVLKLDSMHFVDLGVRVCRKGVLCKAIALQDKVDVIATVDMDTENQSDSIEKTGEGEGEGEGESKVDMVILDDSENEVIDVEVVTETNCGEKVDNVNISDNQLEETKSCEVIPDRFMNSKPVDQSACALRIQKVFRGFLVRKSMRKIKDVKNQIDEIKEKFMNGEFLDLIRWNEKERLKLGEDLMSLVLKLDSIQCVDLGVKVCRKGVLCKAIALQDKVDAIATVDMDTENQSDSIEEKGKSNVDMVILDDSDNEVLDIEVVTETNCGEKVDNVNNNVNNGVKETKSEEKFENLDCSDGESEGEDENSMEVDESHGEKNQTINVGIDTVMNCTKKEDNITNGGLLENLMEGNEKMMHMMTQLFEKNEKQMKMMSTLTHRLELMEKAFVSDKLSKNKKMNKKSQSP